MEISIRQIYLQPCSQRHNVTMPDDDRDNFTFVQKSTFLKSKDDRIYTILTPNTQANKTRKGN